MTRPLLVTLLAAGFALPAVAQTPYSYPSPYGPIPGPYSYAPNVYNRANQPLSPYLNLVNSFNPAASYFYGVRPATQGPNGLGPVYGSGAPRPPVAARTFLPPPVPSARDLEPLAPDEGPRTSLPSPGGVASYGNVFGSSSVGVSGGRYGFFGSGSGGRSPAAPKPTQPPRTIPKTK
jgi:hypothetical protein